MDFIFISPSGIGGEEKLARRATHKVAKKEMRQTNG